MSVYLAIAFLFTIAALAATAKKVSIMSSSTDSLTAAVAALSAQVASVAEAFASLKAMPKQDPADTAAIGKAVDDIQAATASLQAALG